jgi:hypothetical protein
MEYRLQFSLFARDQLAEIGRLDSKKHKKVMACLARLESNPRHPGLNSHRYAAYDDVHGEKIWESYVENRTPGAYRVFWHYGPTESDLTIVSITSHP